MFPSWDVGVIRDNTVVQYRWTREVEFDFAVSHSEVARKATSTRRSLHPSLVFGYNARFHFTLILPVDLCGSLSSVTHDSHSLYKKPRPSPRPGVIARVCVLSSHLFWTSGLNFVDVPAGVTQEEGHTGFLHLPSAVFALTFFAKRIQPFQSLVDCEVEFLCTNELIVLARRIQPFFSLVDREVDFLCTKINCSPPVRNYFYFFVRKSTSSCDCTGIRTHVPTSEGFQLNHTGDRGDRGLEWLEGNDEIQ